MIWAVAWETVNQAADNQKLNNYCMTYLFSEKILKVLPTIFLLLIMIPKYDESYEYPLKAIFLALGIICRIWAFLIANKKKGITLKEN